MNQSHHENSGHQSEADAMRENIDVTRQRMDDTMDALGDRLQPRHLLDEVLGFFRAENDDGEDRLTQMREKISHSATTAMHSVVDTVKQNPMPALLIGAGVAWMLYASNRRTPPASAETALFPNVSSPETVVVLVKDGAIPT